MSLLVRVIGGLLAKEHSVATGLLIALTMWTLTRLVDGVTGSRTIEYDTRYSGAQVEVTLTNLSNDGTAKDLTAAVSDPKFTTKFVGPPVCGVEAPSWVDKATCKLSPNEGVLFKVPVLEPGTRMRVRFAVKYQGATEAPERLVVRIKQDGEGEFRIVASNIETFIARHESTVLLSLLGLSLLLLAFSVGAGIATARSEGKGSAS